MTASFDVGVMLHSEEAGTGDPQPRTSVAELPEPVSPGYRSRVREVSRRCRSQCVVQVPDLHIDLGNLLERTTGFEPATLTLAR